MAPVDTKPIDDEAGRGRNAGAPTPVMLAMGRGLRRPGVSLIAVTAVMLLVVAGLAGAGLWTLRRMQRQLAHEEAARAVLEGGQMIVGYLARQPVIRSGEESEGDWRPFSEQIRSLHAVESGLQYVAVSKGGVTVFHMQTTELESQGDAADGLPATRLPDDMTLSMSREVLGVGARAVPVVVMAGRLTGEDGIERTIEVALRRDTVAREERAPAEAIGAMFRVSLATVLVSFATCVALVVWMMRREIARERLRREEEHLAFAGVLANGIVHDFRNPMSSMRLDVQMLAKETHRGEDCRLERVGSLSQRIQGTLDRMEKVFREFLYISKANESEREPVDIADCLRECIAVLGPRLEQSGVAVDVDGDEATFVMGFPSAVQRALLNVLTNAEQFSSAGSRLRVNVYAEGENAVVEISDQGPGVPPEDRERIFDMFESSRPGGVGLGLFLARTAVERCGGKISVSDAAGGGACFRITLPLDRGTRPAAPADSKKEPA